MNDLLDALNAGPQNGTDSNSPQILLDVIEAADMCPKAKLAELPIIEAVVSHLALPTIGGDFSTELGPEVTNDDVFQTQVSGAVLTIILTVIRRLSAASSTDDISIPSNISHSLISSWPLVSHGLWLYARALRRLGIHNGPIHQLGSPAHAFTTIVSLLQTYAHIKSLRTLVQNTTTTLSLVAFLWKFEVQDRRLFLQLRELFPCGSSPSAADLVPLYFFTLPSPKLEKLLTLVDNTRGESAMVALGHLRKNIAGLRSSGGDLATLSALQVNLNNVIGLHSTFLRPLLLTGQSTIIAVEALLHLTSNSLEKHHMRPCPQYHRAHMQIPQQLCVGRRCSGSGPSVRARTCRRFVASSPLDGRP
ncbi:hypothetical protein MIND_00280500 [Mycena indigotica]|uniref:Uncharacterized protein n=1 Tax=Mycena indigotica TaxID=2126181 RepID=A0A8H6WCB8_9AGAR|nr:uncharacterized protein MIND_00280500 [Mycena indigotica]KAF7312662.1 hypothetical protein MIND_00280500 [Mycena indigotica]